MSLDLLALLLAAIGLFLFGFGIRRIWRWRMVSGAAAGGAGIVLITLAMLLAAVAGNLHTWQRLTHEAAVATLRFERTGEQTFRAYLTTPDGRTRLFDLRGDEWQLDARVLKWHGLANLFGLDAGFQLERLQSRWRNPARAAREAPDVHDLRPAGGFDLWAFARRHPGWIPWVDAVYGSAVYLPMAHGAIYTVHMTQSGLVARPQNPAAEAALRGW